MIASQRTRRFAAVLLLALVASCSNGGGAADPSASPTKSRTPSPTPTVTPTPPPLTLVPLGTFSSPVWVGPVPGDDTRLFLVEKTGRVLQLDTEGKVQGVVLDVRERISKANEQGLLSIAFDPAYTTNKRMYAFLTDKDKVNRVLAYTVTDGVATTPQELLAVGRPFANNNGGSLLFDPTGMLLVGIGDGGSAGDPDNRAQDRNDPHGKILRIDPRTGAGAVGNPFRQQPKVWALGLRKPWRFSFDTNGDFYLGDVGQNTTEELNVLPKGKQAGANYGWSVFEGDKVFKKDQVIAGAAEPVVPALVYEHVEGACSITAGVVYRGAGIPFLKGSFVFGDYCVGDIWATDRTATGLTPMRHLGIEVEGLQAFGLDHRGELLVLSAEQLFRVVTP